MTISPAFPTPETESGYKDLNFANPFGTRQEIVDAIVRARTFDVVVAGGGIHGACVARISALSGLRTLLLERDDYAQHTSSRSSKMAHGGLRYLEHFDFSQVFEGIKAREELFEVAPHLVRPHQFAIPISSDSKWMRFKLKCGLFLYDLMVRDPSRKHSWAPLGDTRAQIFLSNNHPISGAFIYTDGIMDDCRLAQEMVLAARHEGALCLNHATLTLTRDGGEGVSKVSWQDGESGYNYEVETGAVINCAGPWVPFTGRVSPSKKIADQIRYSQGIHLLFTVPWKGPALFLPLAEPGRYYFVWPHEGGTMVGTTEREVKDLPLNPQPTSDEVEEVLTRLRKDLPNAGLDRGSLYHAFAGIRTLPLRSAKAGATSTISRRHQWSFSAGILTLVGGKYTTAQWTATEGLNMLMKLSEDSAAIASVKGRPLPGAGVHKVGAFIEEGRRLGVPESVLTRCVSRYGALTQHFMDFPEWWICLGDSTLRGEVHYHVEIEQAATLDDLMIRRLGLEQLPGHGLDAVDRIAAELRTLVPNHGSVAEVAAYRERIASIRAVMGV